MAPLTASQSVISPDHPVVDALRLFDAFLGCILVGVLLLLMAVMFREKPIRHAIMAGLTSWALLALNSVWTSIVRLGEDADPRLVIRLLGNMIGIAFVGATFSMMYDDRRKNTDG